MESTVALDGAWRKRASIEWINRHSAEHGVAVARVGAGGEPKVDRSKAYLSPELAPLWYSAVFAELSDAQRLRYCQLAGLMQNELICFFETEFAGGVIPALLARPDRIGDELAESLEHFLDDERQHTEMFRRLNRAAEPRWYESGDYHILRLPTVFLWGVRFVTRRPLAFPMVFWVMLMMEERSLMIGRRYMSAGSGELDPAFAEAFRAHTEDEVRHVQTDWHLLDALYRTRPAWLRRANAWLLDLFVTRLFLKPRRANVRLVELLVEEFPDLLAKRRALVRAVRGLGDNAGYRRMMYSAEATPITRGLFERLPEFARLRRKLYREGAR